jgi:hypothetical protein
MIQKYARVFKQDVRELVALAWVDKAPPLLRREAEAFLRWYQAQRDFGMPPFGGDGRVPDRPRAPKEAQAD